MPAKIVKAADLKKGDRLFQDYPRTWDMTEKILKVTTSESGQIEATYQPVDRYGGKTSWLGSKTFQPTDDVEIYSSF